MLISDRADFKASKVIRDKKGHYIMIKGLILQEHITILKVYAPNKRTPNYMRQKLTELQREIVDSTIIAGNFNNPLSETNRFSR